MTREPLQPLDPAARIAAGARAIAREPGLDGGLTTILALMADERAAEVVLLAAVDDDRGRLVHLAGVGVGPDDLSAIDRPLADAADLLVAAALERRSVTSPGPGEAGPAGDLARRLALARLEAAPLVVAQDGIDRVVGVVALGWRATGAAREGTAAVRDALADLAAIAIDRQRQAASATERREWSERLAHLDPLTGLANRRTFDRVLGLEIARACRQGSDVSLALFDVDDFRAINRDGGTGAGDAVLRAVAAVLAESVRLVDTVARIGGDEFVIVAPGSGGMAVAARVQAALAGLGEVAGRRPTVSAGVARFPADGTSPDELLARALDALDAARATGRGALVAAADGVDPG